MFDDASDDETAADVYGDAPENATVETDANVDSDGPPPLEADDDGPPPLEDEEGEDGFGVGDINPNKAFHVTCACEKVLYSPQKTKYTNPVSHAKTCIGIGTIAVS